MKKIAALILVLLSTSVFAQEPVAPVAVYTGYDLSNNSILTFVGLNFNIKKGVAADSGMSSQVYGIVGYLHESVDGIEQQALAAIAVRDAQLWKAFRFYLSGGYYRFVVQGGPDYEWTSVGLGITLQATDEVRLTLGGKHLWKPANERNGAVVYFGGSIRPKLF